MKNSRFFQAIYRSVKPTIALGAFYATFFSYKSIYKRNNYAMTKNAGLTKATKLFFSKLEAQSTPRWDASEIEFIKSRKAMIAGFQNMAILELEKGVTMDCFTSKINNKNLKIQALTPNGYSESSPTIIYFAGGGFVLDLDVQWAACSKIAGFSGCKILIVKCSLAPEHKYPEGANDAYQAIQHFHDNPDKYGINPKKIAVAGDSSGGNFAALTANKLRNSRPDIKLLFQLLISPNVDLSLSVHRKTKYKDFQDQDIMIKEAGITFCRNMYIDKQTDLTSPRISPLFDNLDNLPPTLITCGEFDGVRGDTEAYFEKLKSSGNQVNKLLWAGQVHNSMICRAVFNDEDDPAILIGQAVRQLFLSQQKTNTEQTNNRPHGAR
jgi:acetyl esterase